MSSTLFNIAQLKFTCCCNDIKLKSSFKCLILHLSYLYKSISLPPPPPPPSATCYRCRHPLILILTLTRASFYFWKTHYFSSSQGMRSFHTKVKWYKVKKQYRKRTSLGLQRQGKSYSEGVLVLVIDAGCKHLLCDNGVSGTQVRAEWEVWQSATQRSFTWAIMIFHN